MRKHSVTLLIVLAVFLLVYLLYTFGFGRYLTLANIKDQSLYLRSWVSSNYMFSVSLYILLYIVIVSFSIPSIGPLTILGGFLFGTWYGAIYAIIAATIGATIAFLLFRSVFHATLAKKYSAKIGRFKQGLQEHGAYYLLILHFVVIIPFFVINSMAALADVHLWRFIWTTAVGFIPCAMLYAFAGNQVTTIQSVGDIFSYNVIVALLLLIVLTMLPVLFKKMRKTVEI